MRQANRKPPARVGQAERGEARQAGGGKPAVRGRVRHNSEQGSQRSTRGAGEERRHAFGRSRPPQGAGPLPAATFKLQKRLAEAGLGSRRAMEELIEAGEVSVNGKRARLGMRVAATDRIVVRGEPVANRLRRVPERLPKIVLYHKPEGEIVSRQDPEGRPSVFDRASFLQRGRWLAIGRLDFNTCGLLVFTDSGELANRLSHPRYQVRRDYAVRIVGELSAEQVRLLKSGVQLEDGMARFEVLESGGGEGSNRWYRVRVREGRNRLVRRMFSALGFTVSRLMRTAFGPFELPPRVKRGQWLALDDKEIERALAATARSEADIGGGKSAPQPQRQHATQAQPLAAGPSSATPMRPRRSPSQARLGAQPNASPKPFRYRSRAPQAPPGAEGRPHHRPRWSRSK